MIERLRTDIETALKRRMLTPKDFDMLRDNIYRRLKVLVSATTLKRLWGYLDEKVEPRTSTLSILARFLGYEDWDDYVCRLDKDTERESAHILSRKVNVQQELAPGDTVELTWLPGRVCRVEYLGALTFRVTESTNTRLQPGDTFECAVMVEGEPLYLDNLHQANRPPTAYVCGKKSGIRFSIN